MNECKLLNSGLGLLFCRQEITAIIGRILIAVGVDRGSLWVLEDLPLTLTVGDFDSVTGRAIQKHC